MHHACMCASVILQVDHMHTQSYLAEGNNLAGLWELLGGKHPLPTLIYRKSVRHAAGDWDC